MTDKKVLRIGLTGGIASGKIDGGRHVSPSSASGDYRHRYHCPRSGRAGPGSAPGNPRNVRCRLSSGRTDASIAGRCAPSCLRVPASAANSNRMLHPRIRAAARQQADDAPGPYHIVVVPLLAESPMREDMDRILVVDCAPGVHSLPACWHVTPSRKPTRPARSSHPRPVAKTAWQLPTTSFATTSIIENTRAQVQVLHEKYLSLIARYSE